MSGSNSAPTVRLTGLTKTFGNLRAVDDVDAVAVPGQVTALLGPNGAGRVMAVGAQRRDISVQLAVSAR